MEGEAFYAAAMARLYRLMASLAIGGAIAAWVVWSWRESAAFTVAAAGGLLYFRGLHLVAEHLGRNQPVARRRRMIWALVRLALLLAAVYAIVKFTGATILAPLSGFSIPVAAILVEAVYQLIYARA